MTDQNTKDPKTSKNRFQEEFNALPLDEKFRNLFQMEVATLNDAFSYVANSSMEMFEKVGDAISDLGAKIETEAKKATCAAEPKPAAKASSPKPKSSAKRKPAPPRSPKA